jgi:hypothetical protein
MFISKVRLMAIVNCVAALSVSAAMYAVQTADGAHPPLVDRAALDAREVDKALAKDLDDTANIGMPEIGAARAKALLGQVKAGDPMKTLLKAQYESSLAENRGRWIEFMNGRGTLDFVLHSSERLLEAEREASPRQFIANRRVDGLPLMV